MKLIDADKAIEATWEQPTYTDPLNVLAEVRDRIRELPTVDAEPVRHGEWMVTPVYIKCSECGESFMLIPQNYCPHCGARMIGMETAERKEE